MIRLKRLFATKTYTQLYPLPQILQWQRAIWSQHKLQASLNTIIGIASVLLRLGFVWCTKLIIDIATQAQQNISLTTASAILIGLVVAEIVLSVISRWIKALLGVKAQNAMKANLFTHLLKAEWASLKPFHSGDLINRSEKDVTNLTSFITDEVPLMLSTLVQFLGAFLLLYYMHSTLALLIIVLIPVFLLISRLYVKRMRHLTHIVRQHQSDIQATLQESIQHRALIKALCYADNSMRRLTAQQGALRQDIMRQTHISTATSTVMMIGFSTTYLIVFLWGVSQLQSGLITYGSLMAFIQLVGQIQSPARSMTRFVPRIIDVLTATERLMQIYDIAQEQASQQATLQGAIGVRIDHLSYSYPDGERQIFENVSLHFPPGSRVAIVGETGVGKTTLIRLLLAFIQPTKGRLTLYDTYHAYDVTPASRHNYAYVPQGNTLFSGTIADNLHMGCPEATEEEMHEALRAACADFVFTLPKGLNSRCGELGDGLSEGQAQRIAIARALLARGGLLLLDEATSALDVTTEERVVQHIMQRTHRPQTMLCITHRHNIVKYCTHVVTLERGQVTMRTVSPQEQHL